MKIKTILVRQRIAELDITQKAAAEKIGISNQALSEILRRGTCNGTTLGKLARFAGVKAYEMVDV